MLDDKNEDTKYIKQAIETHSGQPLKPGDVVGHISNSTAYEFMGYEEDLAVFHYNGVTKKFPKSEVFDVNLVKKTAVNLKVKALTSLTSRYN